MRSSIIRQYTEIPNNLFALLSRFRVVIPGIQRHYVQGANNQKAESVRKQFIAEIFNAIENNSELNLHFIYGPINTDGEDSFVPVDGQQRLTTLWLIARYAVEIANIETRKDLLVLLSRFTYEDRINAKRFCQALTQEDARWDISKDPNPNIPCQNWFVNYWKEDETVASMIRMLSTIHHEWQKRISSITAESVLESLASIVNFGLKIDSFGSDIYMKMNARGLQLTQWENFKCKFSASLPKDKKELWNKEIEDLSNTYFSYSTERYELPDNAFFTLYARIMVYEANLSKTDCGKQIRRLAEFTHNTWDKVELPFVPFSDFTNIINTQEVSDVETFAFTSIQMLKCILSNYQNRVPYFGDRVLFDTFFHPQNNNDIDFTLCCYEYFKAFENVENADFIQACRLIWNIIENVGRQSDKVYNRVDIIRKFTIPRDCTLYPQKNDCFDEGAPAQVREEIAKAVKMHSSDQSMPSDWNSTELGPWINWRHAINVAEELAFFNGSIRFLYRNAEGKPTWENFATKLYHSKQLFSQDGLQDDKKVKTNQVLISHCEKWEDIRRIPVFDSRKENWKRILTTTTLSGCVDSLLRFPNSINSDSIDSIIHILIEETIWKELIKETSGYELEWKANSPSLWLNRYLYLTLKLTRNNREDILYAFISNPNIQFDAQDNQRYIKINGKNYYFAIPIFFKYCYNGKEYVFSWQTWGWLDMYDNRYRKLYDLYYEKYGEGFNIRIDGQLDHDYAYYVRKIEECIQRYEAFIEKQNDSKLQ